MAAVAWAALCRMGRDGYVSAIREIRTAALTVQRALRSDDFFKEHLRIIGSCDTSVICFSTAGSLGGEKDPKVNIYGLAKIMADEYGWNLNSLQNPASVHLCVTLPVSRKVGFGLSRARTVY